MASTDHLEAYRIYFDWTNPANFTELSIRGSKALVMESRPKYVYAVGCHKLIPGCQYYWEVVLENGVNFKVGVIKASSSFSQDIDIKEAFTFSSRGMIQSAAFEKGEDTTYKFSAG